MTLHINAPSAKRRGRRSGPSSSRRHPGHRPHATPSPEPAVLAYEPETFDPRPLIPTFEPDARLRTASGSCGTKPAPFRAWIPLAWRQRFMRRGTGTARRCISHPFAEVSAEAARRGDLHDSPPALAAGGPDARPCPGLSSPKCPASLYFVGVPMTSSTRSKAGRDMSWGDPGRLMDQMLHYSWFRELNCWCWMNQPILIWALARLAAHPVRASRGASRRSFSATCRRTF